MDSNQEKQDQSSSAEDSTSMTIEFLRARLLSERSVSKSARQKAEELEKRVNELEEQLRIVSLQRKLAEKATVDVLSILESRGINDSSEAFDSGSDHEAREESLQGTDYPNGEERSVLSKRRSEMEEHSSSDLDSSSVNSRSLAWKGRTDYQHSREKYRDLSIRRHNTFSSIGSPSPKHHMGRSCRQIRRRDTRMVVDESKTEAVEFNSQENGIAITTQVNNGVSDCSDSTQKSVREGSGRNVTNHHLEVNGHVKEKDMEKAIKDQAKLIGRYEEMEKAQREWEEKFRENNNSTPDSYDPGNHSDVTEEREEVKAQTPLNTVAAVLETEEANADKVHEYKEPPKSQANGFVQSTNADIGGLMDQTSTTVNTVVTPRFQAQEFTFQTSNEKELQERSHNRGPLFHGKKVNRSEELPLSETGSSSHKGDDHRSESQNDRYALVPHNPQNASLGSVLDALKQAKLQLHHQINRSPMKPNPTHFHNAIQPVPDTTGLGERAEVSIGQTGLFRLPTDFAVEEANTRANFLATTQFSLPSGLYYPDNSVPVSTPDRFPPSPYVERRSGFPRDDGFRFDRYVYPRQPSNPLFPEIMPVMPRIPSDEGFRRSLPSSSSSRAVFGAPEVRMPFYSDHGRSDNSMYR